MINMVINKIFKNRTKIDTMLNQLDKSEFRRFLFLSVTVYSISKVVKKHDKKIKDLESEVKGIQSKIV